MASINSFDQNLYRLVVRKGREHGLEKLALSVSASGNGSLYLYLAVLFLIFDDKGESLLYSMLAGFIVELPLYLLLKNIIRRPRPCHALADGVASFEPADKFSLPSGHTAAAFVMATSIYLIYPALIYVAVTWAIAIGISRVVLGVHYPMDIFAGAVLGVTAVIVGQQII